MPFNSDLVLNISRNLYWRACGAYLLIFHTWMAFFMEPLVRSEFLSWISLIFTICGSCFLILTTKRRIAALLLVFSGRWIFYFLNFTFFSPEVGLIHWILLAEVLVIIARRTDIWLREGLWLVLSLTYLNSALKKIETPSWIEGTAMSSIFEGVFSNSLGRAIVDTLPSQLISGMGFLAVFTQLFFFCCFLGRTPRQILWILIMVSHMVVCLTTDLYQVSLGMILVHFYSVLPRVSEPGTRS